MGFKELPDPRRAEKGKLRRYKCRNPDCERRFREYYLPEKDRYCSLCTRRKKGE